MVEFTDNSKTREEVVRQIRGNMRGREFRFIEEFVPYEGGFFVMYVTDKGRETGKFGYDAEGKA